MKQKFFSIFPLSFLFLIPMVAYGAYPHMMEPASPVAPTPSSYLYVGGEFGFGRLNLIDQFKTEPGITENGVLVNSRTAGNRMWLKTRSQVGTAGRFNIGFNGNSYLGLELGANAWEEGKFRWNIYAPGGVLLMQGTSIQRNYAVDLLAKVSVPFHSGWLVYGKVGPAYVWSLTNFKKAVTVLTPIIYRTAQGNYQAFRPEGALGVGYAVDRNWSLHLQYQYIIGTGEHPLGGDFIPGMQQFTLGVQYNVV